MTRFYDQALKPTGLKLSQYSVLAHCSQTASINITDLSTVLDVDRTTLTRNLQPLVQAGWVRIKEGRDRRSRAVGLTEDGRELLDRAWPLWQQAERDFRRTMGREDTGRLRHLLDDAALAASH
jgi:DNA-binding MarR family transcriptional regulator